VHTYACVHRQKRARPWKSPKTLGLPLPDTSHSHCPSDGALGGSYGHLGEGEEK
jgi:hypothetical protein